MSFLKALFGKREPELPPIDLSVLKTDVHSHLLFGIDDGVKTIEEALSVVRGLVGLGYSKIITTPHIMGDFYKNTPEIIHHKLDELNQAVKLNNLPVTIEAAAEYYIDYEFENLLHNSKLLTFGDNYLLFEFSYINKPANYKSIIFDMQSRGYRVVLAHPERYSFWFDNYEELKELKNNGVYFQLNLNSLSGYYGKPQRMIAQRLVNDNLIDLIGTDAHGLRHISSIEDVSRDPYLHKLFNTGRLLNYSL